MPFEDLFVYTPHELIYNILLPFIIVFAIFFGVLSSLRIFGKRINLVLSLAFTLAAAYGGLFTWFATYLLSLGAYVGLAAFAIVFIFGAIAWALGRGRDIVYEQAPDLALMKVTKDIEKLYEKYERESDPGKKRAMDRQITELERRREHISRELRR